MEGEVIEWMKKIIIIWPFQLGCCYQAYVKLKYDNIWGVSSKLYNYYFNIFLQLWDDYPRGRTDLLTGVTCIGRRRGISWIVGPSRLQQHRSGWHRSVTRPWRSRLRGMQRACHHRVPYGCRGPLRQRLAWSSCWLRIFRLEHHRWFLPWRSCWA